MPAVTHVVLLGDSVFDNEAYVGAGPEVLRQTREALPPGSRATLVARDGAVIAGIASQIASLPADATHLVLSVGGNDALQSSGILADASRSVADTLHKLAEIRHSFAQGYGAMLDRLLALDRPLAVCTIYDPRFAEAEQRRIAAAALTLLNDAIMREAFVRSLTVLDLRLICNEDADFANAIEPSARGGEKIARAIARFAAGKSADAQVISRAVSDIDHN